MSRILFFTLAFLLGACGEAPSDWSTPSRLFPDLEGFPRTGILTTHRNTVHLALAYEVLDENARKVRSTVYVSRYEAGSWSRAHKLQGNANFSVYPSLVVDRNGTVHAFQVGFDSLTDETYLSSPFRRLLYARGQDTWDSLQTIFQGSLDTFRVLCPLIARHRSSTTGCMVPCMGSLTPKASYTLFSG